MMTTFQVHLMFMPNVELDLRPNAFMLLRPAAYDFAYWVAE